MLYTESQNFKFKKKWCRSTPFFLSVFLFLFWFLLVAHHADLLLVAVILVKLRTILWLRRSSRSSTLCESSRDHLDKSSLLCISSNLHLVGLAAASTAARRIPLLLLEVNLRADWEDEVRVTVLTVDGECRQLLCLLRTAARDTADRCRPAILLIMLLSTDGVDEVSMTIATGDVHGLRTLTLRLLLLAARVAARRS